MANFLDRFFHLRQNGSNVRTELLGGVTTFATMAYIIVVNPAILQAAGIPPGPGTVATILAAVFGTLLMGLYANRPIAVAPYMGENAFIAYGLTHLVVAGQHITWQQRLGTVFVSGAAFLVLTLLGARTWLAGAISPTMKRAFAVGIGLFLLFLSLVQTGIVARSPEGLPLKIGEVTRYPESLPALLAVGGFFLTVVLLLWEVRGAVLLGVVATAVAGYFLGLGKQPEAVVALPWQGEYSLEPVAFQLDIPGVLHPAFFPVLLTLFLISFLDTLGTLVAVGSAGGMLDERGNLPGMQKPMLVDSLACMFSAVVGTSTSGAYIESATGIREGARTGLAAVTTAALFALSLFFIPLLQPMQELAYAYGPALMVVGVLMFTAVKEMAFDDLTEMIPAVATVALMVFTGNIANGLTAGLILHPLLKLCAGRPGAVHPGGWVLGLLCLGYYLVGLPH